jgi:hypothetical protein
MKKSLPKSLLFLAISVAYPALAHAVPGPSTRVPEIDASFAPAAMALLAGGTMMIRERRSKSR